MVEAVGPMYRLKPIQEGQCVFNYNSKMYGMKNLVDEGLSLETCSSQEDEQLYLEVERSQAVIFDYIKAIKKQIEELRGILLRRSSEGTGSKKVSNEMVGAERNVQSSSTYQLVINADVACPPYSLLAIHHLTKQLVSLKMNYHFHSSLSSLPDNLNQFKDIKCSNGDARTVLNVLLIWRRGGGTCVVLGNGHVPLTGEVSLLRFIHSLLQDKLSPSDDTRLQEILDDISNCDSTVFENSVKGTGYLVSNKLTVADLALWSKLRCCGDGRLQQWYRHFDRLLSN